MSKLIIEVETTAEDVIKVDTRVKTLRPFGVRPGERIQIPLGYPVIIVGVGKSIGDENKEVVWFRNEGGRKVSCWGTWLDSKTFKSEGFKKVK